MAKGGNVYKGLAGAVPVLNERATKERKKALDIQTQAALGQTQVKPDLNARRAGQQVAPSIVQAQSKVGQAGTQQMQQDLTNLAGQAMARQGQKQQTDLALAGQAQERELAELTQNQDLALEQAKQARNTQFTKEELAQSSRLQQFGISTNNQISFLDRNQREDLNKLGLDIKQRLFDARLQFVDDEQGRKFANEVQILDWIAASAKSQNDYLAKADKIKQAYQKEQVMYEAALNKLRQALEQNFKSKEQRLDQASKERIKEAIRKLEKAQAKKQRDAKIMGTLIKVGATAVGTAYGGPAGGAAAGGAAEVAMDEEA